MSRFDQEFSLVPSPARWIAAFVGLVVAASIGGIFFVPVIVERDAKAFLVLSPFFILAAFAGSVAAAFVLLVGYVYADAKRRGMNHVLWTLLAIFIPNAIGIILYFILRDPVSLPCPACGTPARKGHAFCSSCGAAVRAGCPGAGSRSRRDGASARAAARRSPPASLLRARAWPMLGPVGTGERPPLAELGQTGAFARSGRPRPDSPVARAQYLGISSDPSKPRLTGAHATIAPLP